MQSYCVDDAKAVILDPKNPPKMKDLSSNRIMIKTKGEDFLIRKYKIKAG